MKRTFLSHMMAGVLGALAVAVVPALANQVISDNLLVKGAISSTGIVTAGNGTAPVSGGSARTAICATSTAGFCIYWGTGAPTISAAQGSIYLNLAGSSSSTRMYVNSSGSTTWVAVTTAS